MQYSVQHRNPAPSRSDAFNGILGGKANIFYYDRIKNHHAMAQHWARVIENVYAVKRALELAQDKEVTSPKVRNIPEEKPGEGIGIVEAPGGTLIHHYWSDEDRMVEKVNLIVVTGRNNAGMCMSVKRAAEKLIHNWKVDQGLLNMVEMAFRAYDPCLACATHALLGETPLIVNIRRQDGEIVEKLIRDSSHR
ncbi:MAG: nickel-dependent hydrogenase large subunit [bacterium]